MAGAFARLWPLHLCGLVLCFGWLACWCGQCDRYRLGHAAERFAANLLFCRAWWGATFRRSIPPAWSLLMEFGANALMALFAIRRSTRGLVIMLAVRRWCWWRLTLTQTMTPFVGRYFGRQ
jgi:hypothetical protein